MKKILIFNKTQFSEAQWVIVASEREKPFINDDDIYHYLKTDEEVNNIKAGDTIELDEIFKVIEVIKHD